MQKLSAIVTRFLISSIIMINCLEKVVDRIDLVE